MINNPVPIMNRRRPNIINPDDIPSSWLLIPLKYPNNTITGPPMNNARANIRRPPMSGGCEVLQAAFVVAFPIVLVVIVSEDELVPRAFVT